VKINNDNVITADPSSDGQNVSDQTLRALLNQEELSNSTNISTSNTNNSNIKVVQIPSKQLVTVVPANGTDRSQINSVIRQTVLSNTQDETGFSVVPDINRANTINGSANVVVTQQVKYFEFGLIESQL
jgi:hypothetical protein